MPTLEINGRDVEVDESFLKLTPEQQNATVDEIAKSMMVQSARPAEESATSQQARQQMSDKLTGFIDQNDGPMRSVDSFMRGAADTMTFGLADETAALGGALTGIDGKFGDYSANLRKERAKQAQRDDSDPVASTTGRVAGALTGAVGMMKAGAPFMGAVPADAALKAKMAQGAASGALYSGLYGAGSGEGVDGRVKEAAKGALIGGTLGGAIPLVTAGVKAIAKPVTDAIKGHYMPGQYANQKIAERLGRDGLSPELAAGKIEGRGTNLTLADVGGQNTKGLLKTATNIPGEAQAKVLRKLNMRQLGQGDRVKSIIRETFADPEKFEEAKGRLFQIQAETSAPLYERALAKENVWNNRLQQFLEDPITRRGMQQGVRIQRLEALAENKQFNPLDAAITGFNEAGDPIIGGVPNMRTINVIKKGFDAMLEGARHPITGRLTEEGRAIDGVRRAFLNEVDKVNPAYKTARAHYASFMQVNDAMEFGRKALTMSPAQVSNRVAEMTPMERISARVGAAEAMRKAVDQAGWTNNAVLKVFNSREKMKNLKTLFNSDEEFRAARRMLFDEVRKRATYDTVKGNSSTAKQLADMADAGQLDDIAGVISESVKGRPVSATLKYIGSRLKMFGGFTPEVADEVATKLMQSDPQNIRAITGELMKIERAAISSDQKMQAIQRIITPMLSEQGLIASQQ